MIIIIIIIITLLILLLLLLISIIVINNKQLITWSAGRAEQVCLVACCPMAKHCSNTDWLLCSRDLWARLFLSHIGSWAESDDTCFIDCRHTWCSINRINWEATRGQAPLQLLSPVVAVGTIFWCWHFGDNGLSGRDTHQHQNYWFQPGHLVLVVAYPLRCQSQCRSSCAVSLVCR